MDTIYNNWPRILEGACINMNLYKTMKNQHQEDINNFPMFFAFSNSQFEEGMNKLGLNSTDTDQIYKTGSGGYYRKTDAKELHSIINSHKEEMKHAMGNDQFLYDAFDYELGNHEYCITWDVEPTLEALGMTEDEVENDARMAAIFRKARQAQSEWYSKHG